MLQNASFWCSIFQEMKLISHRISPIISWLLINQTLFKKLKKNSWFILWFQRIFILKMRLAFGNISSMSFTCYLQECFCLNINVWCVELKDEKFYWEVVKKYHFLRNLIVMESNKAGKCISFLNVVVQDIWFFIAEKLS